MQIGGQCLPKHCLPPRYFIIHILHIYEKGFWLFYGFYLCVGGWVFFLDFSLTVPATRSVFSNILRLHYSSCRREFWTQKSENCASGFGTGCSTCGQRDVLRAFSGRCCPCHGGWSGIFEWSHGSSVRPQDSSYRSYSDNGRSGWRRRVWYWFHCFVLLEICPAFYWPVLRIVFLTDSWSVWSWPWFPLEELVVLALQSHDEVGDDDTHFDILHQMTRISAGIAVEAKSRISEADMFLLIGCVLIFSEILVQFFFDIWKKKVFVFWFFHFSFFDLWVRGVLLTWLLDHVGSVPELLLDVGAGIFLSDKLGDEVVCEGCVYVLWFFSV